MGLLGNFFNLSQTREKKYTETSLVMYGIDKLHPHSRDTLLQYISEYKTPEEPRRQIAAQHILSMVENTITSFQDSNHKKNFLRTLRKSREEPPTIDEIKKAYFSSLENSETKQAP